MRRPTVPWTEPANISRPRYMMDSSSSRAELAAGNAHLEFDPDDPHDLCIMIFQTLLATPCLPEHRYISDVGLGLFYDISMPSESEAGGNHPAVVLLLSGPH